MKQSVVLDISTACTVVRNDVGNVFPLKLILYSCACPITLQFEIQPQEALMCFQVNNFPRFSLRGDLSSLYHFDKDKELHYVIKIQFGITFIFLPLAT